ncbi:BZ3500_MvSof-1268-A1-R1_Chr7-1g09153 [Microbotryum saponariae]|uniref:BZ3500_MvSof-1268-A1-R1_Chr7-1g09153 protein n=1 Tax=Microbotryum saponariae TaxID=289078 RepID=A0A2X0LDI5_9BASI|nr:BZ3501_MvSof-1269-A2-R1_Chr7-1g08858 [Microbotryum saponariae]SDA02898.1 BZ3500_MvSof-1268-A1-R1_Chr7-1g09153 [Microbotryum saponariae]
MSNSRSKATSSSSKSVVAVENAQQRLQRLHDTTKLYYSHGRTPARPTSKTELDVLKEHHRFIRSDQSSSGGGGAPPMSWEDQLAEKYYQSLFREFALVELKHYKTGAIALRWRTEEEVISGIGNLTCAALRCEYHQPDPTLSNDLTSFDPDAEGEELPLVSTRLTEQETWFGYMEEGIKKSALVKVVLCKRCGRKLKKGREVAKRMREGTSAGAEEASCSAKDRGERQDHIDDDEDDEEDFAPKLPPDLEKGRSRSNSGRRENLPSSRSRHRRRSASPESRRR